VVQGAGVEHSDWAGAQDDRFVRRQRDDECPRRDQDRRQHVSAGQDINLFGESVSITARLDALNGRFTIRMTQDVK
jgi:hypothetical protein